MVSRDLLEILGNNLCVDFTSFPTLSSEIMTPIFVSSILLLRKGKDGGLSYAVNLAFIKL